MSVDPLVSVVVIFLDAKAFITEAIESAFSQSHSRWELVVDDGSSDRRSEIARPFARQYPARVTYLKPPGHANQGMSASRNLGLDKARGEFIAYLDADEVWLDHKLEEQVAILQSEPEVAMVYGRTEYWWSWTGRRGDHDRDHQQDHFIRPNRSIGLPLLLNFFLIGVAAVLPISNFFVRRAAAQEVGGLESQSNGLYEDQVFLAKISLSKRISVSDRCWDRYRQHEESLSSKAERHGALRAAPITYLEWLEDYLTSMSAADGRIARVVKQEL